MIHSLRSWRAAGVVAPVPRAPRPPRPDETRAQNISLQERLREKAKTLETVRGRNATLERQLARLQAELRQSRALLKRQTAIPERLKGRIIVLKARNYDLRRQLAEANAFLAK